MIMIKEDIVCCLWYKHTMHLCVWDLPVDNLGEFLLLLTFYYSFQCSTSKQEEDILWTETDNHMLTSTLPPYIWHFSPFVWHVINLTVVPLILIEPICQFTVSTNIMAKVTTLGEHEWDLWSTNALWGTDFFLPWVHPFKIITFI